MIQTTTVWDVLIALFEPITIGYYNTFNKSRNATKHVVLCFCREICSECGKVPPSFVAHENWDQNKEWTNGIYMADRLLRGNWSQFHWHSFGLYSQIVSAAFIQDSCEYWIRGPCTLNKTNFFLLRSLCAYSPWSCRSCWCPELILFLSLLRIHGS